jgi:2-polyprenyl-3-methyl-5-hydroxy-6-metoxy-1,4-benzoquinol methylase
MRARIFKHLFGWLPQGRSRNLSRQHQVALRYWKDCSDTFLASPEYYDRCEKELRSQILPRLGKVQKLLDAGCGNGRFTLLLAQAAQAADAYDVSPLLIERARAAAEAAHIGNVCFEVRDISGVQLKSASYDVVSCMGVLSTIIDEPVFLRAVQRLRKALRPGGFMLLRETLSSLPDGELTETEGYAIRYRNDARYRHTLAEKGLQLEYEAMLIEAGSLTNRIQLYRLTTTDGKHKRA